MYSPSLPHTEFPGKFFLSDLRNPLTRTDYHVTELFRLPSHADSSWRTLNHASVVPVRVCYTPRIRTLLSLLCFFYLCLVLS